MKLVNLTPHPLTLQGADGALTVPPSGQLARVAQTDTPAGVLVVDG